MAKTVKIQVISGSIHYGNDIHLPGKQFDCDPKEAKRLVDMKVAFYPVATDSKPVVTQVDNSALLDAIAAANSPEALAALMPETEPEDEIKAAFEARMAELEK